jgi:hypothetical protein
MKVPAVEAFLIPAPSGKYQSLSVDSGLARTIDGSRGNNMDAYGCLDSDRPTIRKECGVVLPVECPTLADVVDGCPSTSTRERASFYHVVLKIWHVSRLPMPASYVCGRAARLCTDCQACQAARGMSDHFTHQY